MPLGAAFAAQVISQAALLDGLATQAGTCSGRLVEPADVAASLVARLASPAAAGLTGQEYLVDGALTSV